MNFLKLLTQLIFQKNNSDRKSAVNIITISMRVFESLLAFESLYLDLFTGYCHMGSVRCRLTLKPPFNNFDVTGPLGEETQLVEAGTAM